MCTFKMIPDSIGNKIQILGSNNQKGENKSEIGSLSLSLKDNQITLFYTLNQSIPILRNDLMEILDCIIKLLKFTQHGNSNFTKDPTDFIKVIINNENNSIHLYNKSMELKATILFGEFCTLSIFTQNDSVEFVRALFIELFNNLKEQLIL